jgi:N-acetylmuramoyl-L-alanine amidase
MTRTEDVGLYSSSSKNKKREDLRNRVKVINNSNPELVVSIHQNSFSQEKYKGAQTFYYASSEKSQQLAKYIQNSIKIFTDIENRRKIKPNKSYYLLKQSKTPIVIVECGFLSNYGEAKKLEDEEYQDKIAWAIYIGISAYINNISN